MSIYNEHSLAAIQTVEKNRSNADFLYHELLRTRELNQNLYEIMETLTDGFFITDKNAVTLRINRAYETITGIKREELVGQSTQIMVEKHGFNAACAVLCAEQKKAITLEQTLKFSGKKVLVSCYPIFDDSGEIKIIVGTLRDLTELEMLKITLAKSEELRNKYKAEIDAIKTQLDSSHNIVAEDKKMLDTVYLAKKVAAIDVPVLLNGETGVGKEEIAKFIYNNSPRKSGPFIKINCGAIPATLIESELFGYERGAFTGASTQGKPGLLEAANKGTVFLDEVGELPLNMQVKLLRVLQEREVTRIGGVTPIKLDVRIISATNQNLEKLIEKNEFRLDFYYRIKIIPFNLPPLRERPGDIKPLVNIFLTEANYILKINKRISDHALSVFYDYKWPGNVRELKNCVLRAAISSDGDTITESDLQRILYPSSNTDFALNGMSNLSAILEKTELKYMNKAYATHKTVRKAAKMLGMAPSTFQRRRAELMRKHSDLERVSEKQFRLEYEYEYEYE